MNYRYLNTPWATSSDLYSAPGSLIVKLALGEAPESIPAQLDVRRRAQYPATSLGIVPVDRVFNHFSERVRITRVHTAAASLGQPGRGHRHFNDLEHILGLSRTFRVETDSQTSVTQVVDALRQLHTVEQAYPHYLSVLPFSAAASALPGLDDETVAWSARELIRMPEAMGYETGDPAVICAIVDTGIAQEHVELDGRFRSGVDTVQLVTNSLAVGIKLVGDYAVTDIDPEDFVGHGTACAAIIGGAGVYIPPGLAGECGLLPVRVLGAAQFPGKADTVGIGAVADIDAGVKSAIDLGAKVINMSFGTPESLLDDNDPPPHQDVVRYGLARNCVLVAASGNSGREEAFSPAALDGVIAVGAVGGDAKPAAFTTRGDHVALCAPGERIFSAGLEGYQMVTGTSFAAPFVTAAAGLLVSRAARRSYPLTGTDVRDILCETSHPWGDSTIRGCGSGVLDVYAALRALDRRIDSVEA